MKQSRWKCPTCGHGLLAPTRPRRNDVRRYCLPCSSKAGVLVERVEGFAKPAEWRRACAEINDFEHQLVANGLVVLKFWLAVTPEEQLARFKAREHSPFKRFKITAEDWRNRDRWDDYARAANEMFARCDTPHAPWHVIAANDKRVARLRVLQHVVTAVEKALDE